MNKRQPSKPIDWSQHPEAADWLELELCIDTPFLSGKLDFRPSQAKKTQPLRTHILNMWLERCNLKICNPFPMSKLSDTDSKPTRRQRDFWWWTYPPAGCWDHRRFLAAADSGDPAALMVEPYHFNPATYEEARPGLEAAGLTFASTRLPASLYDPLRTSVVLIVRKEGCPLPTLDAADLASELARQKQNAKTLLGLTALECVYKTAPDSVREALRYAIPEWAPLHPDPHAAQTTYPKTSQTKASR